MPTVEFGFPELTGLLGKAYSPKELESLIPMIGVDLESIDDEKIIVEIFPDRTDMLSIEGFARALKGFLGIETGSINYTVKQSDVAVFVDPSVKDVRPNIVAGIVRGVKVDNAQLISLMSMQEKLHLTHGRNRKKVAIGVHDSKQLKPPFYYKAVKPSDISFVPLDTDVLMNLSEILSKHPMGRDYASVLEGLSRFPVIVDDKGQVLSFPPIINGELTRVTKDTKDLFIEVTGMNQVAVEQALNIVVTSIADRSGEIFSVGIKPAANAGRTK